MSETGDVSGPSDGKSTETADISEEEMPDECLATLNRITNHMTRPGRLVFVEENNSEAWISTDTTVEVTD